MDGIYLWVKALHVASVTVFAGGVLVTAALLPMLNASQGQSTGVGLAAGLRGWARRVTLPALLLTWVLGIWLAVSGHWFASHWLSTKLVFVLALTALHGMQAGALRRLAAGTGASVRAPSWAAPAVIASVTIISILVVVKPF